LQIGSCEETAKENKNKRRKAIEAAAPYSGKLCWVAAAWPAALLVGGKVRVAMEDTVGEPKEKKRTRE